MAPVISGGCISIIIRRIYSWYSVADCVPSTASAIIFHPSELLSVPIQSLGEGKVRADAPDSHQGEPDEEEGVAVCQEVKTEEDEYRQEADKDCFTFHFAYLL